VTWYKPAPEMFYQRVRGREGMGRRQLAILRELAIWRDQAARQENLPTRTLLKDSILMALARHPATTLADLETIRDLPRPVETAYGRQIVEATARALALNDDQCPAPESTEKPSHREAVDKIWDALGKHCVERSISPALVASRKEVARVYRETARGKQTGQPAQHRLLRGWRKELLGNLLDG